MKIKRIKIKNFRSVGEEGIDFKPKDGLNTIVGENNVGKSNILKALKLLVDTLEEKHKDISEIEWHNGVMEREFEISVEFILNKKDLDIANQNLTKAVTIDNKTKINRLKKDFGEKVEIIMSHKKSNKLWDSILFKWGILYLNRNNEGFLNFKDKNRGSHSVVRWTDIVSKYIDGSDEKSINSVIEERLQEREHSVIDFAHPVHPIFMTAFKENIKLFEDIRQKPIGEGSDASESFDGRLIADVLFNLSTGYLLRRGKYQSIQEKFGALFPNLELAAVQDKTSRKPDIHVI
jgi:AAA15 family ATPase/GTPase